MTGQQQPICYKLSFLGVLRTLVLETTLKKPILKKIAVQCFEINCLTMIVWHVRMCWQLVRHTNAIVILNKYKGPFPDF